MATANVQGLTIGGTTADNGTGRNAAIGVRHPPVTIASQQFEIVFHMFLASISYVSATLGGNYFCWQKITVMISATYIDGVSVSVTASVDCTWNNITP